MIFPDFLPSSVLAIHDSEAIALLHHLQRQVVQVPWSQEPIPIATAYVHYASARPSSPAPSTPLLLIHGFDSSLLEFRRLIPFLSIHQEVWAIDLFGSGFTQHIPDLTVSPLSIRQHLLSVIETWICQPVILVGASLGGAVAIDLTLHHSNWVRSLILIDSVGFSGSFPVGQFLPQPVIEFGANWLSFRKQAAITLASTFSVFDPATMDALRCAQIHQDMPGWKAALTSFTQSGGYFQLGDRISQVTQPTLIVWGDTDDVLGTQDATRFERAMVRSQLVWIRGAGHAPHLEQPELVAEYVRHFVQQLNQD